MDENEIMVLRDFTEKIDILIIDNGQISERVNTLLKEKEQPSKTSDIHVISKLPVAELIVYPELLEDLPSINEDFYKKPLPEEERIEVIYSFPKTSAMKYSPPQLNETASASVKKIDATLYRIQAAIVKVNRLIDFFVHRRIQENPGMDEEEKVLVFEDTMRILCQLKRAWRRGNKRRGVHGPPVGKFPAPIQAEDKKGGKKGYHRRISNVFSQKLNKRITIEEPGILKQSFLYSQEDGRSTPGIRLKEIENPCSTAELQNEITHVDMQDDFPKRLPDVDRSTGCFSKYFNTGKMQEVSQISMEWDIIPILRSVINWERKRGIKIAAYLEDIIVIAENKDRCQPDTKRERSFEANFQRNDYTKSTCYIYRQGSSNKSSPFSWSLNVQKNTGTEESATFKKLKPRRDQLKAWNGHSFFPENPEHEIFTDASDTARGVLWDSSPTPQIELSNRMVHLQNNLYQDYLNLRSPRRISVCNKTEQQGCQLLQLLTRPKSSKSQLLSSHLVTMNKPLLLRPVESDSTNLGNIVTGFSGDNETTNNTTSSNSSSSRPQKRKISAISEQELEPGYMEARRSILQNQGLSEIPIRIMVPNQRGKKKEKVETLL
ncbi:hypothetical protein AYI68_g4986 [Smittium mucronatum]|uniref:Uncharacterized protein n=1 Tax=Smittium mucronatum TaxID=133383 RepID=A0A1R0GVI9_9FUNG|nr:hypothetical protein AYI68_g4986 [Smittium mucronatum]